MNQLVVRWTILNGECWPCSWEDEFFNGLKSHFEIADNKIVDEQYIVQITIDRKVYESQTPAVLEETIMIGALEKVIDIAKSLPGTYGWTSVNLLIVSFTGRPNTDRPLSRLNVHLERILDKEDCSIRQYTETWRKAVGDLFDYAMCTHRVNGPARTVIDEQVRHFWYVEGKHVESFEGILSGKETWQEYIDRHPEFIFILPELARVKTIEVDSAILENIHAMA